LSFNAFLIWLAASKPTVDHFIGVYSFTSILNFKTFKTLTKILGCFPLDYWPPNQ